MVHAGLDRDRCGSIFAGAETRRRRRADAADVDRDHNPWPVTVAERFRRVRVIVTSMRVLEGKSFACVVAGFSHELSHVVLCATGHRLQHDEKAVDLTAMSPQPILHRRCGSHENPVRPLVVSADGLDAAVRRAVLARPVEEDLAPRLSHARRGGGRAPISRARRAPILGVNADEIVGATRRRFSPPLGKCTTVAGFAPFGASASASAPIAPSGNCTTVAGLRRRRLRGARRDRLAVERQRAVAAPILTVSPSRISPASSICASGSCTDFWITRFSGRAP